MSTKNVILELTTCGEDCPHFVPIKEESNYFESPNGMCTKINPRTPVYFSFRNRFLDFPEWCPLEDTQQDNVIKEGYYAKRIGRLPGKRGIWVDATVVTVIAYYDFVKLRTRTLRAKKYHDIWVRKESLSNIHFQPKEV
jgi:hypothetical protein